MPSQVEAQQGGMAEQRDRLHALLASQATEKEALEREALASAAERAGLASQLLELQVTWARSRAWSLRCRSLQRI